MASGTGVSVRGLFRSHVTLQLAASLSCISVLTSICFAIVAPDFGCALSFQPQHHLLQAWISGGAFAALLLLGMTAITSRRMHHDVCTWYCLFILLNAAVRFLVASIDREHLVCVTPLGGMGSGPDRGYSILTFVFWGTSAPATVALLASLSGSSKQALHSSSWAMFSLVTGAAGTFCETPAPWIILELASFMAECVVIYWMCVFVQRGLSRAHDRLSRALWLAILPIAVGAWLTIPAIWLLCQFNIITQSFQVNTLNVIDFVVKLAFVILNIGESARATFRDYVD